MCFPQVSLHQFRLLMHFFRWICVCWVLFVYSSKGVNCRWSPTEFSNQDDNVDTGKSVVDSKREMSSEYQLEKSISSHGKDETRTRSQKRQQSKQNKNQRKKKRQLDNRIRAHNFDAFEADYVDFGAVIGQGGAFSWHANYSPE